VKDRDAFDEANREWDAGNLTRAFKLFNMAAENGSSNAFNSIGYFFDYGLGVKKDQEKALYWYKKAARSGDSLSFCNIGLIFRDRGNSRRAKYWLTKATRAHDGDAALELAKIYMKGSGEKAAALTVKYLKLATDATISAPSTSEEAKVLLKGMVQRRLRAAR
jgi:TPR repeat protein